MPQAISEDDLIRLYAQPGQGYTDQELADIFEVGRDAIFKRRRRLKADYGEDFFKETERGRYRVDSETFVSHLKVSWEEALVLYLATRRLSRSTRLPRRPVYNALSKLATALYKPMTERLVKAAGDVSPHPESKRREEILTNLLRGWSEQLKVHIRYQGLKSEKPTKHTINPYLIEPSPWSDSVYIVAKTNVWDGFVPFQLERIEKAVLSTEAFSVDPKFEEETLLKYAWGIWSSDDEPETVRLRFTGKAAIRRLQESVWHPKQELEPQLDGSLLWSAPIAEWREMLPWIRGWGSSVEVIEPEKLREALKKTTIGLNRLYQTMTTTAKLPYQLLYAKTNSPDNKDEIHLLLYHLIDVGQVALVMWQDVLTDSIRRRLAEMLGLSVTDAGRFIAFLAALHDLGKACPGYQKKYAPPWLLEELQKAGLKLEGSGKAHEKTFPHGTVSTWALEKLLPKSIGLDKIFAYWIAVAIGGHHGSWPSPGAAGRIDDHGEGWDNARRDLLWEVQAVFQPPHAVTPPAGGTELNIFLTIFSGLVSVADWLGSRNKECFGFEEQAMPTRQYAAQSAQKARESLKGLGWLGWQPNGQTLSFADAFAYLDFKAPRGVQPQVIEDAQNLKSPTLLILEAPTGIGKTEAALYLADGWLQQNGGRGLYVAMPTQATSNQMYKRIGDFLSHRYPDTKINYHLVHGQAAWQDKFKKQIELQTIGDDKDRTTAVQAESWFTPRKRTLLAPFGVGTVDQTLMSILQTRHFFVRLFGLSHKVVIFDEVHAYDTFMSTLFTRLLEWLNAIGTSVIILSATLPAKTRRDLVEAYIGAKLPDEPAAYPTLTIAGPDSEPKTIALPKPEDVTLDLSWDVGREPAEIRDYLQTELAGGGCAAVICNTVRRAQDIYRVLDEARQNGDLDIPEDDLILFHARFPPVWRKAIEDKVLTRFGKPNKEGQSPDRPRKAIVVATQVIEQSLDLDFDLMLTDLAPIDLIIQRAGRLHRHNRSEQERRGLPRQLVIIPPEMGDDGIPQFKRRRDVYEPYILFRSYLALRKSDGTGKSVLTLPQQTTTLIETVYGNLLDEANLLAIWQETLKAAQGEMEKAQREAKQKAGVQLILAPGKSRLLKQRMENLEEDNPAVHKTFRAQTRDIDPGISLICLHRAGGKLFIYGKEGKIYINLDEILRNDIKPLQQNTLNVQHKGVFHYFVEQQPPPSWQKEAALRHCRPVIFENGVYDKHPKYTLQLNRTFGLEITKKEDV